MQKLTIWLSYVSYPVTTAVYFERALRKHHQVITLGPKIGDKIVEMWNLQNMKVPIVDLDIPCDSSFSFAEALKVMPAHLHPNLFLWVESVNIFFPQNLSQLTCPKACYLIDSHLNLPQHLEWAKHFDYVFIAQKEYISDFKAAGIAHVYWIPLGADPVLMSPGDEERVYDIGFVGSVGIGSRRETLLNKLAEEHNIHYERAFWDEMVAVFRKSRIVFNNAVKNDLNMRFFEVMSTGACLLSDMTYGNGQEEMFIEGEDYIAYDDSTITEVVSRYLPDQHLCEQMAQRGMRLILNAHTYEHRVLDLIDVAVHGKSDTFSAVELRQRSLDDNNRLIRDVATLNRKSRSFVIPVLDESPDSFYGIDTLLSDLSEIDGTVIVIFNSPRMAEKYGNHPRIDLYSVMSQNIGVARAWNIGLDMSRTDVTFILNADLQITVQAVESVEQALLISPEVAIAGPEGSFFCFEKAADYQHFRKSMVWEDITVDAVSGFFFAVRTSYFHNKVLKFENAFTPCYFEEWDLGLQIKKAGLRSVIAPIFGYHHQFSLVKKKEPIRYYDESEEVPMIHGRNMKFYMMKWGNESNTVLRSLIVPHYTGKADVLIQQGRHSEAFQLLTEIDKSIPNAPEVLLRMGTIAEKRDRKDVAAVYYRQILEIYPEFEEASKKLNAL